MAPTIDAFLRRTDDRRGRIYRVGRNGSFGRHQCRKAARGKGTDRSAADNDIGTNTILCIIVELANDGRFKVLDDLAEITRLGEGLDRSGRIDPEAERRSLDVLRRYLDRCSELGVEEFVAGGTSALRDAKNSSEVRARLKQRLGLEVRVLDGEEEAAYSYLAVQRGLTLSDKELLVIDIGGGSNALIWGKENGVYRLSSPGVGSVRLTERVLHCDPARGGGCEGMVQAIDRGIKNLLDQWGSYMGLTLVGIAGTFTTLAAVEEQLTDYSHSEVHGTRLALGEVRRQIQLYREKSIVERKK